MPKSTTIGTELWVDSVATPGTFIKIGNVTNLGVPGPERGEVDSSDFDSAGAESLPGFPDFGEVPFTVNYNATDPGQQQAFDDAQLLVGDTTRAYRIDFTQQDVRFSFNAWMKRFRPNAGGVNAMLTAEGVMRVSGVVTRTTPIPA